MKTKKLTGIAIGVLVAAGGALAAQQNAISPSSSQSSTHSSALNRSSTLSSSQMSSGHCIRGSQIIGSSVKSSNGQDVGQVRDLVVDPQSGRIEFAVLSLSGEAGSSTSASSSATTSPSTTSSTTTPSTRSSSTTPSATTASSSTSYSAAGSGKLVPVPWQLFSQNFSGTSAFGSSSSSALGGGTMSLTLNIDEAKLRGAPSFEANNWSALQGSDFGQRSYTYYGLDWNNRMSGAGTAGSGVSSGIGSSSSDRGSIGKGSEYKSDTSPKGSSSDSTRQPQAK